MRKDEQALLFNVNRLLPDMVGKIAPTIKDRKKRKKEKT